jgi:hypothetical protein
MIKKRGVTKKGVNLTRKSPLSHSKAHHINKKPQRVRLGLGGLLTTVNLSY